MIFVLCLVEHLVQWWCYS